MSHRTAGEIEAGLARIRSAPRESGTLVAIAIRPERDARRDLESCRLDAAFGAEGDRWVHGFPSPALPGLGGTDGQLTLMNSRVIELLAGSRDRWSLAGDQLYVDLDLSEDHLRAGDRLRIGDTVVVEINAKAHNGCRKFAARFGETALAWVNSPEGKHLHLRGIYAGVVTPGTVRAGDRVVKLPRSAPVSGESGRESGPNPGPAVA